MFYLRKSGSGELLSLAAARAQLGIEAEDTDRDAEITAAIAAAVALLDGWDGELKRALLTQVFEGYADHPTRPNDGRHVWAPHQAVPLPGYIRQPGAGFLVELGPVQSIDKVERLVDGTWTEVPAADYLVAPQRREQALVLPKPGRSWPSDADPVPSAWRVTFTAGFGAAADVPAPIVACAKLFVSDLFENRDAKQIANLVENPTVGRLLAPYRLERV